MWRTRTHTHTNHANMKYVRAEQFFFDLLSSTHTISCIFFCLERTFFHSSTSQIFFRLTHSQRAQIVGPFVLLMNSLNFVFLLLLSTSPHKCFPVLMLCARFVGLDLPSCHLSLSLLAHLLVFHSTSTETIASYSYYNRQLLSFYLMFSVFCYCFASHCCAPAFSMWWLWSCCKHSRVREKRIKSQSILTIKRNWRPLITFLLNFFCPGSSVHRVQVAGMCCWWAVSAVVFVSFGAFIFGWLTFVGVFFVLGCCAMQLQLCAPFISPKSWFKCKMITNFGLILGLRIIAKWSMI